MSRAYFAPVVLKQEEDSTLLLSFRVTQGLASNLFLQRFHLYHDTSHTKQTAAEPCSIRSRSTFHNMGT
ncbi:hypothetical protein JOQ06_009660, partial [Pogonophryne albipinna]